MNTQLSLQDKLTGQRKDLAINTYNIFLACLIFCNLSRASYILPEFSIETKKDLEESTVELIIFKSRSQNLKRDEVVRYLSSEEKVKLSKILNDSRYGRDDSMYWNGPILKEYGEIGFINITNSSGVSSKYWLNVTQDLKNWSLTTNKESFSSTNVGLYFDESGKITSFIDFKRIENLNYLHVPFFRWLFYLFLAIIIIVVIKKRKTKAKKKSKGVGKKGKSKRGRSYNLESR